MARAAVGTRTGGDGPREGRSRMPWKNNSGGPRPPCLEELLRKGQDRFKGVLPGGGWGAKGVALVIALVIAFWMASGFYRVEPDEQGVVLRFGKYVKTTGPGLNYHLPAPI